MHNTWTFVLNFNDVVSSSVSPSYSNFQQYANTVKGIKRSDRPTFDIYVHFSHLLKQQDGQEDSVQVQITSTIISRNQGILNLTPTRTEIHVQIKLTCSDPLLLQ